MCDLTPGNGIAAVAAFWLGLQYDALCTKPEHAAWLDRIFNNAVLKDLASGQATDESLSDEFLSDLRHYFASSLRIEEESEAADEEESEEGDAQEDF